MNNISYKYFKECTYFCYLLEGKHRVNGRLVVSGDISADSVLESCCISIKQILKWGKSFVFSIFWPRGKIIMSGTTNLLFPVHFQAISSFSSHSSSLYLSLSLIILSYSLEFFKVLVIDDVTH